MSDKEIIRTFYTEAYKFSILNKSHLLTDENRVIIRGRNTILVFEMEDYYKYRDYYDKIIITGLTEGEYLEFNNKLTEEGFIFRERNDYLSNNQIVILKFDSSFFTLRGKKNRKIRRFCNYYAKMDNLEIFDTPLYKKDIQVFLRKWKSSRKGLIRKPLIGVDQNFILNYILPNNRKFLSKFFYIDKELVGYSIIEHVSGNLFNHLTRKANINYNHLALYIDYVTYSEIFHSFKGSFLVSLGNTGGMENLLKEKTENFPVYQTIRCFDIVINKKEEVTNEDITIDVNVPD
jgi:hypothetical protein